MPAHDARYSMSENHAFLGSGPLRLRLADVEVVVVAAVAQLQNM